MPGCLVGALGPSAQQPARVVAWISGHQILVGLISIGVVAGLLAGPVLGDIFYDLLSTGAERAAPKTFLVGLGILAAGLVSGFQILDIVGGGLIGLLVLAFIVDNYLTPGPGHSASPEARAGCPRRDPHRGWVAAPARGRQRAPGHGRTGGQRRAGALQAGDHQQGGAAIEAWRACAPGPRAGR